MADTRPAASLTPTLLARRGDARPAMRRQAITHLHVPLNAHEDLGWNDTGEERQPPPSAASDSVTSDSVPSPGAATPPAQDAFESDRDEDGGEAADAVKQPHAAKSPFSPLTSRLDAITQRIANIAHDTSSSFRPVGMTSPAIVEQGAIPRAERGLAGRKAAFTLRLDAERHMR